jgi:hypothetical protein
LQEFLRFCCTEHIQDVYGTESVESCKYKMLMKMIEKEVEEESCPSDGLRKSEEIILDPSKPLPDFIQDYEDEYEEENDENNNDSGTIT